MKIDNTQFKIYKPKQKAWVVSKDKVNKKAVAQVVISFEAVKAFSTKVEADAEDAKAVKDG